MIIRSAALLILVGLGLTTMPAQGQDKSALNKKVDSLFTEWDKPTSPGCALGVIKDGAFIYKRGYGMANLEQNIPISPTSVFDIGSTSKQFAATCVVLLAQKGKLSFDDEVRKYIPELPNYGKPITIRHILTHTSGLRDYPSLMELAGYQLETATGRQEALDIITRQKALNFNPGDEWLYSNTGFFLASVIVERVSGKTLNEFATENIFAPLGMKNTIFLDDHTRIIPNRAIGYDHRDTGGFKTSMSNWEQTGDGAVQTSVEDLKLWDDNFYNPKVGGPELIQALTTVGKLNNGEPLDYGFGLRMSKYKGLDRVTHGGAWAGYRAELARFPKEKLSVICLCNLGSMNPSGMAMQVADIYLADKIEKPKKEVAPAKNAFKTKPADLQRYAGAFRRAADEVTRTIEMKEGKLVFIRGPGNEIALEPVSKDKFSLEGETIIAFTSDGKGQVSGFDVIGFGKPTHFEPFTQFNPTNAEIKQYEGTFHSDELETSYIVSAAGEQLNIKIVRMAPFPLNPVVKDSFSSGLGGIKFVRDSSGNIKGFTLSQGRAQGIIFEKK
jgi:CubicO group peptidase (beta-lactamase class C family)